MAQPAYAIEYLGAISAKSGKVYTSASVITAYPTATCMQMKTDGVSVSVNGSDAFLTSFDDESFITSGHTYIFTKDCVIAVGKYRAVT